MPQFLTAITTAHTNPASNFHLLTFQVNQPEFHFTAGQYITLRVADAKINKYSISNRPHGNKIDLIVDISPGRQGSQFIQKLRVGEEVNFLGPFGIFTPQYQDPVDHLLFLATGSGIAPLKSMIEDALYNRAESRPISLYFGLRFVEDIFLKDHFDRLAHQFPNFHFHLSISRPDEKWEGEIGHITDLVARDFPQAQKLSAYLCGSGKMVESAVQLLANLGMPPEHIYHEKFFDL